MKKKLILIGGTMGVGKTTLTKAFVQNVKQSVMLDGDWCWEQGCDWNYTDKNKKMVLDNICFLLNSFMKSDTMNNIVLCWVLHLPEIHKEIIERLQKQSNNFDVFDISLICDDETSQNRILKRVKSNSEKSFKQNQGNNQYFDGAKNRMECLKKLDTIKIDVSNKTEQEVLREVTNIVNKNNDLIFWSEK